MNKKKSASFKNTQNSPEIEKKTLYKMFKKAPHGVIFINKDDNLLFLNTEFTKITGYTLKDIPATTDWYRKAYPDPEYRKMVTESWRDRISRKGISRILKVVCKDGKTKEIEFRPTELEKGNYLIMITDLTEKKKAEEILQKKEELYRGAIEITGAVPYYLNYKTIQYEFVGENIKNLTGYSSAEFTPEVWKKMIKEVILKNHLKDYSLKQAAKRAKSDKDFHWLSEYKILTKKGKERWLLNSALQVSDDKNNVIGSLGILQDITEQKKTENIKTVLYEISRAVNSAETLEELFIFINRSLGKIIDTSNIFIGLYDKNEDLITFPYFVDQMDEKFKIVSAKDSNSLSAKVLKTKKPLLIKESGIRQRFKATKKYGTVSKVWLGVPLKIREEVIGLIGVQSYTNPDLYSKQDIEILGSVSEQIAAVIQRKQAEEALKNSEMQYRTTIDSIDTALHVIDRDFNIILTNKKIVYWNKELGITNDLIGKNLFEIYSFLPERVKKEYSIVFKTGKTLTSEEKTVVNDMTIYTETSKIPIIEKGRVTRVITILYDITERKLAEQLILESEEKFRMISDQSLLGICIIQDGFIKYANQQTINLLEYSFDEVMSWKSNEFIKVIHPEFREFVIEQATKKQSGDKDIVINYPYKLISKSGRTKWINQYSKTVSYKGKFADLITFIEITDQKRAEEIKLVLHEISNAVNSSSGLDELFKFIHDSLGKIIDTTNFFITLLNEENQTLEFPYFIDSMGDDYSTPLSIEDSISVTAEVVKTGNSIFKDKNGWLERYGPVDSEQYGSIPKAWLGVPLKVKGKVIGAVVVQSYTDEEIYSEKDIELLESVSDQIAIAVERKMAEEALAVSEETYRNLFQNAQVGISRTRLSDGKMLECNEQIAGMFGYENREEMIKSCFIFDHYVNKNDRDRLVSIINNDGEIKNFEAQFYRNDGQVFWIRFSGRLSPDKSYIEGVAEDITLMKKTEEERKRLEGQLYQSQKMESIGRLAGGVAHDFNNILTSVMGYAEILKMTFPETSKGPGKAADVILKGSQRAADLTKQLLGFARGGKYNPAPININFAIRDAVTVSEKIFEKNINVVYNFEKNIGIIEADENQMNQVFTNLIINAKDAMPSGGNITFSTENVSLDENYIVRFPEFRAGNYVKISVSDSGIGMIKSVKDKIFEPFFTTKGTEKGTGLGLATVYGIVKNHSGHINVESESGKGTTFIIHFPVSEKALEEEKESKKVIKGIEKILLVEDEELVRKLVKDQLKTLGYRVVTAKNGLEAVKIYKQKRKEIDLVLLDMIMPKLAGRETFLKLKEINKKVKALLMSGFSQDGKASEILNDGALGFLQKPFDIKQLSEVINKALKS